MDPRLRLERAIGVPDAIVLPANRTLIAARLLRKDVEISFDAEQNRMHHGLAVDRALDIVAIAAIDGVAARHASGDLDLLLVGEDEDSDWVSRIVADLDEEVHRAMRGPGMNMSWAHSDNLQRLVEKAVVSLRRWAADHLVEE